MVKMKRPNESEMDDLEAIALHDKDIWEAYN